MRLAILTFITVAFMFNLAAAGVQIEVRYSRSADAFELMDNVSQWWPGYTELAYREAWVDSFEIAPADSLLFAEYAQIRNRYYDKTGQENDSPTANRSGLFTDRAVLNADPVAYAFYGSATLEESFQRLQQIVDPDEVDFLRSFYAHFSDRMERITGSTEPLVASSLERTRQVLEAEGVGSYLNEISGFFGVSDSTTFTALYVWWPDADRIVANPNGPYLLLRVRPYEGETMSNADVVVHEAVHVISAMQSPEQKRLVSDVVLAACPDTWRSVGRLDVLEEPLAAVLGNVEFRRRFEPKRFKWSRPWYGDRKIDLMARVLYPVVMDGLARKSSIEGGFAEDAAALCQTVGEVWGAGEKEDR